MINYDDIKPGTIIKGKMDFGANNLGLYNKEHYYIVLNHEPIDKEVILLSVCTSNIPLYLGLEEMGQITENDFHIIDYKDKRNKCFPKDTVIVCNDIFVTNIGEIHKMREKGILDEEIFKEIKDKIRKNKSIETKYKKKI